MQLTRCVVQMNVRKSSYAYKFIDVEEALVLVSLLVLVHVERLNCFYVNCV